MFGHLENLVDPYTDFAKGTMGVHALQSIDIAVRHAELFAVMQDAIAQPRSLPARADGARGNAEPLGFPFVP